MSFPLLKQQRSSIKDISQLQISCIQKSILFSKKRTMPNPVQLNVHLVSLVEQRMAKMKMAKKSLLTFDGQFGL